MSFKMVYDTRNRGNLDKLADNTRFKAYQLYQYCINNNIQILIYETIRTKSQQQENVRKGASKTMKSYHLVGQALDWVLVDSKKNALWNGYKSIDAQKVIKYAKSIGFVSGYDWGWDAPHLQYEYRGYGTDTFGKLGKPTLTDPTTSPTKPSTPKNNSEERVIKLLKDSTSATLRNEFVKELEQAFKDGVFTDKKWIEQAKSGEMSLADAFLLNNRINKSKQ